MNMSQKPTQTPQAQPERADTLLAQPVEMTKYQALRKIGAISHMDYIMLTLLALVGVTLFFWRIFAAPTFEDVLGCVMAWLIIMQLWLLTLVCRCIWFVVNMQAALEMMPEAAAKIVMASSRIA